MVQYRITNQSSKPHTLVMQPIPGIKQISTGLGACSNTPCQPENTCYDDWFVPAKDQLDCLNTNFTKIGGFKPNPYWSSTESSNFPEDGAWFHHFGFNDQQVGDKALFQNVRCVRSFTP